MCILGVNSIRSLCCSKGFKGKGFRPLRGLGLKGLRGLRFRVQGLGLGLSVGAGLMVDMHSFVIRD